MPNAKWFTESYIRERDMGVFVGHSEGDRAEYFPMESRYSKSDTFYWCPPGGESIANACIRVDKFLESLASNSSGLRVVVVCHGNIMKCFRVRLERMTQTMFSEWEAAEKVSNGQIMWYSRRDPNTGFVGDRMEWTTSVVPGAEGEEGRIKWRKVKRPAFTNDDMLSFVENTPPMILGNEEMERHLAELKKKKAMEKKEKEKAEKTQGD